MFEVEARMVAELRAGYCSHPDPASDPCSGIITRAHTVQKRGGLSAIAELNHVLTVKPTMKAMIETEGDPEPRSIGVNNASVFPGFCSKHDSELFKPVEGKTLPLNRNTAFLLAYRAVAYERFAKAAQQRGLEALREADKGHPFWKQAVIQIQLDAMAAGVAIGVRDVDGWKAKFDSLLLSGERDAFHFLAVRFDRVLPVVACSAFHPEFDLEGKPLQRLGRAVDDLDHVTLTVTAFEGSTLAVFGWIGTASGTPADLAGSFQRIADARKADAIVRLLFVQTDNLFLRPSWWNALPEDDRRHLRNLTKSGTTIQERTGGDLSDDAKIFCLAEVTEIAGT